MKTVTLRSGVHEGIGKFIKPSKREQCLITHGSHRAEWTQAGKLYAGVKQE